jgi:hypothetical protein
MESVVTHFCAFLKTHRNCPAGCVVSARMIGAFVLLTLELTLAQIQQTSKNIIIYKNVL